MRRILLVLFVICTVGNAISQEFELIRHQVQMGETVRMLSKKYKVEPSEIYRLNKFAIEGISQGMTLQILVPKKDVVIAEDLGVIPPAPETVTSDVYHAPEPVPAAEQPVAETKQEIIMHTVIAKETLYGLSKKYNISVEELKRQNEKTLEKGLKIGQVLTINSNN